MLVVVVQPGFQDAIEMLRFEEQKMVQAFPANGADEPFDEGSRIRSANCSFESFYSLPLECRIDARVLAVPGRAARIALAILATGLDRQLSLPEKSPRPRSDEVWPARGSLAAFPHARTPAQTLRGFPTGSRPFG